VIYPCHFDRPLYCHFDNLLFCHFDRSAVGAEWRNLQLVAGGSGSHLQRVTDFSTRHAAHGLVEMTKWGNVSQ